MEKTIIVYWSGTGNTEVMAEKILSGINSEEELAKMIPVFEMDPKDVLEYNKIVLGCPAMGLEDLEAEEFEPFFEEIEDKIAGKKIALFGSYGWGGGEWMDKWEARVKKAGAVLFEKGLKFASTPSSDEELECVGFGERFSKF